MFFFFFPVLDPHRLVISFIALIYIVSCLQIHLHKTMQMGFVFFLRTFQVTNPIAIVIVITYNVVVIDYIVILVIRNRSHNRAGGK